MPEPVRCETCGAVRDYLPGGPEPAELVNVRPAEPEHRCGAHLQRYVGEMVFCGAPATWMADDPAGGHCFTCDRHSYRLRRLERKPKKEAA